MIQCPFCQSIYPENTLFCVECGSYLAQSDGQSTDPLQSSAKLEQRQAGNGPFKILVLSIEGRGSIELPLSKEVVLGRLDPTRAIFPDVDLSDEEGVDKGISRRHARISQRGGQVFVEDLNSLNGTFLNATRLVPEMPYPLKDGDQIQLGKLTVTVNLK